MLFTVGNFMIHNFPAIIGTKALFFFFISIALSFKSSGVPYRHWNENQGSCCKIILLWPYLIFRYGVNSKEKATFKRFGEVNNATILSH